MADFTQNIVNQRFKKVYDYLEKHNIIKGKSDIAKKLGTYNHVINSILQGKRNITVDQLNKLFELFQVNANFLFGSSDTMIVNGVEIPTHSFNGRSTGGTRANIELVTHKALAGNLMNSQEREDEVLSRFAIPGFEGNLIAIEIEGDSMYPTITGGDIVVCEQLERGESLKANAVYVIATKDGVVAKRIQPNRMDSEVSSLSLISDNSSTYKPYDVDLEDVLKIMKVKCRLTNFGMN